MGRLHRRVYRLFGACHAQLSSGVDPFLLRASLFRPAHRWAYGPRVGRRTDVLGQGPVDPAAPDRPDLCNRYCRRCRNDAAVARKHAGRIGQTLCRYGQGQGSGPCPTSHQISAAHGVQPVCCRHWQSVARDDLRLGSGICCAWSSNHRPVAAHRA